MKSTIKPCNCHHAQQDTIHGKGMRAHNPTRKISGLRCTVCRAESFSKPAEKGAK